MGQQMPNRRSRRPGRGLQVHGAFFDRDLRGPRAGAMWRMLAERATSLEVTFSDIVAAITWSP